MQPAPDSLPTRALAVRGGVWVPGGPRGLQHRRDRVARSGGFDSRPPPPYRLPGRRSAGQPCAVMHVLATAGHVDHGKSSLVRALTGQEPDRYAEEQRRGLTLDLGFVWTTLDGETIAFVDVRGHERFVPTMLAGLGPVPAVVLFVAADGGWMPQTQEHLDAIEALGVRHGLVVVSRADLADPEPVRGMVRERLRGT